MLRVLIASPVATKLALLTASVVFVIIATVYGQIRLNSWNQPFYDALTHRDFPKFFTQLGVFAEIAGALLVLNVAQRWLAEMITLKLREGLMGDLVREWLKPRRAFRLSSAGPIGINPDQRMHEDTRHLCELSSALAIGCFQASTLLLTFLSVLWVRSSLLHFRSWP